ncbi:unnamed protein product [Caenorhabditis auriculariae]|uniref:receptor protein serine/threonine kinase n=1 Tax=Caenorhabditis auriculariae TaxID=2777116 RepID=A0A8S1H4C3_9PELO|nr:unnamed protein product [Caenorhabditis auriculariae]
MRRRWLLELILLSLVSVVQFQKISTNSSDVLADALEYIQSLAHDDTGKNEESAAAKKYHYHLLGIRGINYELNGTVPFLTCQYLNRTECDPEVRSDCPRTINCYLERMQKVLACLGVYSYVPEPAHVDNNSLIVSVPYKDISYLGCFSFQGDTKSSYCDQDECASKRAQMIKPTMVPGNRSQGYGFCCCHTRECNRGDGVTMPNPYHINVTGWRRNASRAELEEIEETEPKVIPAAPLNSAYNKLVYLSIALLCVTVTVAALLIGFHFRRRFSQKAKANQRNNGSNSMGGTGSMQESLLMEERPMNGYIVPKERKKLSDFPVRPVLNIDSNSLVHISMGRFGHVYRGIWKKDDGTEQFVAVKKHNACELQSFLAERIVYEELESLPSWYPSVLRYLGAQQVDGSYWIITEFHERLSLYDLIKNHVISLSSALRIIVTMVDGLQFLHDERPFYLGVCKSVFIHRDLKSKNILIRRDMTACIADFGLARRFDFYQLRRNNDILGQVGTRRYMSPEVLEGATEFTPAAFKQMDVYAMALCMWEVLSRTRIDPHEHVGEYMMPYEDVVGGNPQIGAMRAVVVSRKLRPMFRQQVFQNKLSNEVRKSIEEMWDPEADGRITAGCAFQRMWRLSFDDLPEEGSAQSSVPDPMMSYHTAVSLSDEAAFIHIEGERPQATNTRPHPSRDPFLDVPLPPAVPRLGGVGAEAFANWDNTRPSNTVDGKKELVYDTVTRRLLSDDNRPRPRRESSHSTTTPETSSSF